MLDSGILARIRQQVHMPMRVRLTGIAARTGEVTVSRWRPRPGRSGDQRLGGRCEGDAVGMVGVDAELDALCMAEIVFVVLTAGDLAGGDAAMG